MAERCISYVCVRAEHHRRQSRVFRLTKHTVSRTSMGRATTTARGAQRAMQQEEDVKAAKEDLASARADYERLEQELAAKIAEIRAQA